MLLQVRRRPMISKILVTKFAHRAVFPFASEKFPYKDCFAPWKSMTANQTSDGRDSYSRRARIFNSLWPVQLCMHSTGTGARGKAGCHWSDMCVAGGSDTCSPTAWVYTPRTTQISVHTSTCIWHARITSCKYNCSWWWPEPNIRLVISRKMFVSGKLTNACSNIRYISFSPNENSWNMTEAKLVW